MSVLQPALLLATIVLVVVCARVSAKVYGQQRAALVSEAAMKRLRHLVAGQAADAAPRRANPETSLEQRVLEEILGAPSRAVAVLALNELTSEVSRALADARTLPPAVGRVALLGGTALGLTAMATSLDKGQAASASVWGGTCVVLALVGAAVCAVYGRLARSAAERRREQTRELIRMVERRLP